MVARRWWYKTWFVLTRYTSEVCTRDMLEIVCFSVTCIQMNNGFIEDRICSAAPSPRCPIKSSLSEQLAIVKPRWSSPANLVVSANQALHADLITILVGLGRRSI